MLQSQNLLWFASDSYFSYERALAKNSLHLKVLNVRNVMFGLHRYSRSGHTLQTMLWGIYLFMMYNQTFSQESVVAIIIVYSLILVVFLYFWNWNLKENGENKALEKWPMILYYERPAGARCNRVEKNHSSHYYTSTWARNSWEYRSVAGPNFTEVLGIIRKWIFVFRYRFFLRMTRKNRKHVFHRSWAVKCYILNVIWASQVELVVTNPPVNAGDLRHKFDPWVRKIPWRRASNPFQYSCLENPGDRGA